MTTGMEHVSAVREALKAVPGLTVASVELGCTDENHFLQGTVLFSNGEAYSFTTKYMGDASPETYAKAISGELARYMDEVLS